MDDPGREDDTSFTALLCVAALVMACGGKSANDGIDSRSSGGGTSGAGSVEAVAGSGVGGSISEGRGGAGASYPVAEPAGGAAPTGVGGISEPGQMPPWNGDLDPRLELMPEGLRARPGKIELSQDGKVIAVELLDDLSGAALRVLRWEIESQIVAAIEDTPTIGLHAVSADGGSVLAYDEGGDFLWLDGDVHRLPFHREPADCVPHLGAEGDTAVGCLERQSVLLRRLGSDAVEQVVIDGLPPGTNCSMPLAINANGTAIGGVAYQWNPGEGDAQNQQPLFWTEQGGTRIIPLPPEVRGARVVAVGDDGQSAALVGLVGGRGDTPKQVILRWSENTGTERIVESAQAIASADLGVLVGADGVHVYRWSLADGLVEQPMRNFSYDIFRLTDASSDGRRLLGVPPKAEFPLPAPFLLYWELGPLSAPGAAEDYTQHGFESFESASISADGRYVAGLGRRREDWTVFRLDLLQ